MNTTKKNNLSTIVTVIVAMLFSGGAIAGGIFFLNQNNQLLTQISQREAEFNQMRQKVAQLPFLREKSAAGIKEIKRLRQFIPSQEEQAAFVLELEHMAKECGVDIISCTLNDKTKTYKNLPTYKVYQWEVEFEGDYRNIKNFLEALPKSNRFVKVSFLSINSQKPDSKSRKSYLLNTKLTLDLVAPVEQGKVNP